MCGSMEIIGVKRKSTASLSYMASPLQTHFCHIDTECAQNFGFVQADLKSTKNIILAKWNKKKNGQLFSWFDFYSKKLSNLNFVICSNHQRMEASTFSENWDFRVCYAGRGRSSHLGDWLGQDAWRSGFLPGKWTDVPGIAAGHGTHHWLQCVVSNPVEFFTCWGTLLLFPSPNLIWKWMAKL